MHAVRCAHTAALLFFLVAPGSSRADLTGSLPSRGETRKAQFSLEAESAESLHDLGGAPIEPVTCRGASGGMSLQGFDAAGEWVEFALELPFTGTVRDSVRSAGNFEVRRTFVVEFRAEGNPRLLAADTLITRPGSGLG